MGRLNAPLLALALGTVLTVALSACGSSGSADLLPGDTASEINSNLDQVQQLASEGDCAGASEAAGSVSAQVDQLEGVDAKLKEALVEGAGRLNELVGVCEEEAGEEEAEEDELQAAREGEALEEAEKAEKEEKPGKEKPKKDKPEKEEKPPVEPTETPGEDEVPPSEEEGEGTSGGVGPGAPAGSG